MSLKIAVLGTGANGSCIAASLIDAGLDVTLIDQWPAHVEAMRAQGLTITMPEREQHVTVRAHHLCDVCTFNHTFDVVLLDLAKFPRWVLTLSRITRSHRIACSYHIGESMVPSCRQFLKLIELEETVKNFGFCKKVSYFHRGSHFSSCRALNVLLPARRCCETCRRKERSLYAPITS